MLFYCGDCSKTFQHNFTLRRHVRSAHPGFDLPEVSRGRKPKDGGNATTVQCRVCMHFCRNRDALHYHQKCNVGCTVTRPRSHPTVGEKLTMEFQSEAGTMPIV